MFKVGDYLVCRNDVYKVIQIIEKKYNDTDYYVLNQVNDKSLKMEIPVSSDKIRPLIDKSQIEEIINKIPNILEIDISNGNYKIIEIEYKKLVNSGKHEDLLKIIKTNYLKNKGEMDNNKKISDKDETYFKLAEKYLYTEISIVLGISYDDVKRIVIDKVNN